MSFCPDCLEPITGNEIESGDAVRVNAGRDYLHLECLVRSVAGSVTHIRRECVYYGGTVDCHACEVGLSRREAARASLRLVRANNLLDECSRN